MLLISTLLPVLQPRADTMAGMTKTQIKRSLKDIRRKAFKLLGFQQISIADYQAIERICEKNLKKLS